MADIILAIDCGILRADWHVAKDRAAEQFVNRLFAVRERVNPFVVFCCWDNREPTFRHKLFPEYKAGRTVDEAFLEQKDIAVERMIRAGFQCIAHAGYEADDLVATVASRRQEGEKVVIYSADKDCRQLLGSGEVILLRRWEKVGGPQWYGSAELWEEWKLRPSQWIDFQAMCGDKTDNVKGIKGVGEKTAAEWLQGGNTLEDVLAHKIEGLTDNQKKNIDDFKPRAEVVTQLVTLCDTVPIAWRNESDETIQPQD